MARRKTNKVPIIILLVVLLLVAALLGGMIWFVSNHFFVGGRAYANDAQQLDLRGERISIEEYEAIRTRLPEADIRWDIPFQGNAFPDDTTALTVSSLNQGDLDALSYFKQLKSVDATACRDYEMIRGLQARYPDVDVDYTVVIGGQEYGRAAQAVVCADLTDEDIELMAMLPQLKTVDANGCSDPDRIAALSAAFPEIHVSYEVHVLGQTYTEADVSATFSDPDLQELKAGLACLPGMEKVHLVEPTSSPEELRQLMADFPDITFTWDKTVLGKTFNSAETIYDLSEIALTETPSYNWRAALDEAETARITSVVEEAMAWFPNAEKVILPPYAFHNETMGAFREKMRPEYKTVWTVYVTSKPVRTDQEVIHSSAYQVCFIDEQSQDLYYCEDAIVVDIGHSYVKDVSWVRGMPKLKYLILTHNWIKDLTPLSTCKNLVYLELYWNDHIPDYSPLLECTALEDLNVSGSFADIEPLYKMTWLKNLWANCKGITPEEDAALKAALPNTTVMTTGGSYTTNGWRQVQGYYDMRDIMGLPYNTW